MSNQYTARTGTKAKPNCNAFPTVGRSLFPCGASALADCFELSLHFRSPFRRTNVRVARTTRVEMDVAQIDAGTFRRARGTLICLGTYGTLSEHGPHAHQHGGGKTDRPTDYA